METLKIKMIGKNGVSANIRFCPNVQANHKNWSKQLKVIESNKKKTSDKQKYIIL